jgi:hypothetical protein
MTIAEPLSRRSCAIAAAGVSAWTNTASIAASAASKARRCPGRAVMVMWE